eukprot:c6875_g1_i1 orf=554-1336(-)
MEYSENSLPLQGSGSPPFPAATLGSRKEKKKQAKEDRDRQKQVEKKRRRLEKALATSAAIRLELEKKKQRKREEEQRLDEEGAALAEAVALQVLLDEDTDGVAHMETFTEIGLQSLSILSGSDQTLVGADGCVSYFSSHGPFDCMLSSGLTYHSSFAYTLINGGHRESLHSFKSQNEFMNTKNQNCQVAVRLGYENPKAWIDNNNWEERVQMCSEKATKADMAIGLPSKPVAMLTVVDKTVYNVEADKNVLDAVMLQSLG